MTYFHFYFYGAFAYTFIFWPLELKSKVQLDIFYNKYCRKLQPVFFMPVIIVLSFLLWPIFILFDLARFALWWMTVSLHIPIKWGLLKPITIFVPVTAEQAEPGVAGVVCKQCGCLNTIGVIP